MDGKLCIYVSVTVPLNISLPRERAGDYALFDAMQKLRSIHLYLGCIFAPLLLFFAISGIWQTVGFQTPLLRKLSSIHTEARWKDGSEWGSIPMRMIVLMMAIAFIITTVLGVIMAIRFGRSRKAAYYCLAVGTVVPVVLVLMRVLR